MANDEAIWLSSFDISNGDVKWVFGFTAVAFRAGVSVGDKNLWR